MAMAMSGTGTNLVDELGTGETTIVTSAAYLAGFRRELVLTPPHLARKWKQEMEETVPHASAAIVMRVGDLGRRPRHELRPQFLIHSRERAKLSYRRQPALVSRLSCAT
jgi:hypothetical protein